MTEEIKLRVGELTERSDFGRGIVRLSAKDMKRLGITEGDIVEIEGKRKTAAIVIRAYPADVGLDIIRMDGLVRRNCNAGIGEPVAIRKADAKEAKSVTIAPARKGIIIHMGSNLIKQNLLMRPVLLGDIIIPNPVVQDRRNQTTLFEQFFGVDFGEFFFTPFGEEKFVVVAADPKGIIRITRATDVELLPQATKPLEEEKIPEVTYEDLGGLHEEVIKVREMIELPLKHPELFERLGIEPPKGILLHGVPGTGKTLLAKAVANESGAKFFVINGPEVMCVDGETEVKTTEGVKTAKSLYEDVKKSGKVTERHENLEVVIPDKDFFVYALNEENKIVEDRIHHAFKLKSKIYRVKLSNGAEVRASYNQPFLIKRNDGNEWVRITELREKEQAAVIGENGLEFASVNSIEELGEGEVFDFAINPYSNFIGGNPAVVVLHNSKFYGESLTPDESIFTVENGLASVQEIGEVVKSKSADSVAEFDEEGRVQKGQIKSFIEHPFQKGKKIYKIRTSTGREIKVTDYHSLFALKDGKISDVKTSDITAGDTYLAVPSRLPAAETYKEIDILKELSGSEELSVRSPQIKEFVKKTGIERAAQILDVKEKYVYDIYGKNVAVSIKEFLKLAEESGIPADYEKVDIVAKQNAGKLPAKMTMDEDFATLVGLFLAEGSYTTKDAIRITNSLPQSKEVVRRFCEKYGIHMTEYEDDMLLNSKPLKIVFEKILGIKTGADNKEITPKLMSMPLNLLKPMLRGYFTGDGSVYPPKMAHTIEGSTHSRKLANSLMYTLLYFGIVSKCSVKTEKNGKLCYRVLIQSPEGFKKFLEIGFLDEKRNARISNYLNSKKFDKTQKIPIWPELREMIKSSQRLNAWSNSKTIGKDILKKELMKTDPEKEKHEDAWRVVDSELVWDKVVEKKEIDYDGNVYDVSVNPNENFVAGFGGIFAHNSEENLRKVFDQAEKSSPAIIFIDEIDAIAPKREEVKGEVEKRVVSQLLTLMDGLKSRGKVIVIGATNIPNSIDPALRRPGRFDREIEIGVPTKEGRKEILQIHTRGMPLAKEIDLDKISEITYGYVGADLAALCKEAAMHALRRVLPDLSELREDKPLPPDILKKLIVIKEDFDHALKMVAPSAMREVLIEIPKVKWDDIGGLEEVKQQLREVVEWPLEHPESFKRLGISPPRGILLYGPPGCGKTLLAKAVANESGANFISVKGPELLSMWVGESEKHIRDVFRRAKQVAPSIIFFDEIDALVPRRGYSSDSNVTERVVSQLLAEISGLEDLHDVVVVAATNRPDIIDPALLRPGRLDRQILTTTPDEKARHEILKVHTKDMPLKDVDLKKLAKETEGFSGADIEALCREAAMNAMRKDVDRADEITKRDFDSAFREVKPSVSDDMNEFYASVLKKRKAQKIDEEVSYTG
ncbi:MAG: AAA family ATPase [Candidatus Aenigmarchaeota archaeon]|nr:AAA family ATPase [Candidatus Aenigmarchaeota archaeon]